MMITKSIKNIITTGLVCCGIVATLTLVSCGDVTDYDDGYVQQHNVANSGAPVITGVYAVADADFLTVLKEAEPGQRLCIVGENLNNLKSLKFNTVDADLAETYTMLTKAVVRVPAGFSKNHDNVIEYTTDMGTVKYAFVVTLPTAEVGGLLNEFAAAGSQIAVDGKNLQYYDFTLTLNGQQQPLTVGENSLSFRIPEGTPDNSVFVISWVDAYGQTQTVEMPFRPTNELLFADITQAEQQQTDRNVSIEASDMGMPCLHFQGTITEYAWVELSFAQPFKEICEAAAVADYYFVFEVQNASGKPLLGSGYEFAWNWDWNNSYRWNPGDGEGLDTDGQWQTVRFSLEQLAPNGLGTAGTSMVLNVGFQPDRDYEADFRLANFRIIKK
ncbi:MAG: hypothetical protein IJ155_05190 [Prevotella sp.]|nr:hypothetical protein [Prevotella sp.]